MAIRDVGLPARTAGYPSGRRLAARAVLMAAAPWLGAALVMLVLAIVIHRQALNAFLDDTARGAANTLQLVQTSLEGYLERFERLPFLLASQPEILALAEAPGDPQRVEAANLYLRDVTALMGASDIYFMDPDGLTRAASNFDTATSFVGGNFAFRPYFTDAVAAGAGRFYALGTTSQKRGYYFGAPVSVGGAIAGVLVVKIDLDAIESIWGAADHAVLATDPQGVAFLSSEPAWLFALTRPIDAAAVETLARTRRYAGETLREFPATGEESLAGHLLRRMQTPRGVREFLVLAVPMPHAEWTLTVMQDVAPARRQALTLTAGAVLALSVMGMAAAVFRQRRARLRDRLTMQAAAQAELEGRVIERTRELADLNAALGAEVAERRQAEENLRRAQDDLIQAAKLAALGQMSAALSHEFNQPLGALRNYAENAGTLIERGRVPEARTAIERIVSMVDRMAAIARRLHTFARHPGQRLGPVDLAEAVEAAREIAELRLRQCGATLTVELPDDLPQVVAGPVRLQQVLVNLLTNAADAVAESEARLIRLSAAEAGEGVELIVEDSGPGVPEALAERIFDPFFSTKGVGNGLGLGLSISYNILKDFGGGLTHAASPLGGAAFRMVLRRAEAVQDSAA